MGEDTLLDFGLVEDKMQGIIKVIGVGGGGCNAVRNMFDEGVQGVTYAVFNTDSQSLSRSPVPVKLMLGTSGLGAGANPELGKQEAEANVADIEKLLSDGTKMVFVTAGMGGGTGTGAAPVVAKVAKNMGLLTVGVVTIPFYFEKKKKIIKALKGVEELRKNVDALLIVNNERLCDVYTDSELSVKEAFQRADHILMDAVKGISELITMPSDGGIKSDFRDVETTMKNGGGAIMAIGRASGDHRVERAILDALDSPLLHGSDINHAKRILFNIYASDEMPILVQEMEEISEFFDQLDPDIDVIWGTSTDDSLGEDAKVIILAADMSSEMAETKNEVHDEEYYRQMMDILYAKKDNGKAEPEPKPEPDFTVEVAQEPEPAERPQEPAGSVKAVQEAEPVSTLSRWKRWLNGKLAEIASDDL